MIFFVGFKNSVVGSMAGKENSMVSMISFFRTIVEIYGCY